MNDNLHKAKAAKNDEFYTQLCDIEKELSNYPADTFKNKIIYCPCDVGVDGLDVPKSNFVKYFEMNKERLGYKQLLHTSLQEGYDFHSTYCTRLLNEADIVVTNPPFSLFRDFFKWLMDNKKDFIIVGNQNAISYAEVFPYIKDGEIWTGVNNRFKFITSDDIKPSTITSCWFTNCDIPKHHDTLILVAKYTEEKYPKYENYDAIAVSSVKDIPCDYYGVMGVPITYLYQFNSEQFEICGLAAGNSNKNNFAYDVPHIVMKGDKGGAPMLDGKPCYARILIKRRTN